MSGGGVGGDSLPLIVDIVEKYGVLLSPELAALLLALPDPLALVGVIVRSYEAQGLELPLVLGVEALPRPGARSRP